MAFDGTLKFDTAIDKTGFKLGIDSLGSIASKGLKILTGAVAATAAAAGTAAAAVTGYSISVGKNFEESMSNVLATMGKTKESIVDGVNVYDVLSEAAKKAGTTTVFSASEAADALNYLALAGYDATKASEALPAVLDLAAAGSLDLAYASDLVTDSMAALGIEATKDNLTHFGDMLAKTASSANASVGQLGEAILVCGGQAKLAKLDTDELCTMLGVLANNGIKGAEGGTALRNLLKNMYNPTTQAKEAMDELGISFADTTGKLKPVQQVLSEVMTAIEGVNNEQKELQYMGDIFDVRTIAAASAGINNSGKEFTELQEKINDCNGAMSQMAATKIDNLDGDIKILKSNAEAFGIAVYQNMDSPLRDLAQSGSGYLEKLTAAVNKDGLSGFAEAFGDVAADAVEKLASYAPEFIKTAGTIITSLADSLAENALEIVKSGMEAVQSFVSGILSSANMLFNSGIEIVSELLKGLIDALPDLIDQAVNNLINFLDTYLSAAQELYPLGAELLQKIVDGLVENIPKIIPKVAEVAYGIVEALTSSGLIETIIGAAIPIVTALADGLFAAAPIVYDMLPKIISNIFDILSTAAPEFGRAGWELIKHLASGIIEVVPQMFTAIGEIVMALVDGLIEYFPEVWEAAKEVLGELWEIISEHFGGFFENIGEHLYDANEGIKEWCGKVIGTVVDWLGELWETVSEKVGGFFENIGEYLYDAQSEFKKWLGNVIGTVINWAVEMYTNAKETAKNFVEFIIEFVKKLPGMMWENFTKTVEKVVEFAVELRNKGKETARNFIENIIEFVKQLPTKMWNNFTTTIGKVVEFAVELRDKGKEAAENLVKKITDGIKELPQKMTEAGRNLVEGLWNGITGAGSWLKSKISEFGSGIIDGFKSAFGIHSPSTVMRDRVGKFLAQGVGVGFADEMPTVRKTAVNAAEKIVPDIAAVQAFTVNSAASDNALAQPSAFSQITNNYSYSTINNANSGENTNHITLHAQFVVGEEIVAEGVTDIIADKIDDRQGVTVRLKKRGVAI